jgi:regulator of protease activity HflC (stomatin/prohibitin superfamily)
MFKSLIQESQRGLLFKNGKAFRFLEPGAHSFFSFGARFSLTVLDVDRGYAELSPELAKVLPAGIGEELVVEHGEIALVFVDGRPEAFLVPGRYVLFQDRAHVTAIVKSTAEPMANVPQAFWSLAPATHLVSMVIASHERGLLYVDGKLDRVLQPGAYAFHKEDRSISVLRVDVRERELAIVGQEVMTRDHVTLRMNVTLIVRVVDPVKSVEAVQAVDAALYSEAQLVVRRFVASHTVDDLLEARLEAAKSMRAELLERAREWGVEVVAVDMKDLVLPGEMKTILNRVVEASKQAEANNIMRREETAATRSLANTAKMLQDSPMLLRLKELESYKELAREIDQLTIVVSPSEVLSGLKLVR